MFLLIGDENGYLCVRVCEYEYMCVCLCLYLEGCIYICIYVYMIRCRYGKVNVERVIL